MAAQAALSEHDRFLIARTEEAVHDGKQLFDWFRRNDLAGTLKLYPIDLKRQFRLPNKAEGVLDFLEINGKRTSVMGVLQTVEFGQYRGDNLAARLKQFVLAEFLSRAHWIYPDGHPGGFTIQQSLYKTLSGEYGKFLGPDTQGCVDLSLLGAQYDWVLLTAEIHDFVMHFGPLTVRPREAACVSPAPGFMEIIDNPAPGWVVEILVGYPFVEFAPIPNYFGFGPGKFKVAIKTYSFQLSESGDVRARMYFAAAPRCKKVFDIAPWIPDPVYGGADLLSKLSLGLWSSQGFHDRLDSFMLAQHSRVHQALMDGVEKVWREWLTGGDV
ncbi:MAG: hypothetical protein IPM24_12115 [Bryobacterales bacterium]|nr:hypothetical protein [Bryobacterales bacterium]